MNTALILVDFINEIIHEDGKLAGKGYADFAKDHQVLQNLSFALQQARRKGFQIIHVRVGFSEGYVDQPKQSPLFGKAHEYNALQLNTWATAFHEQIDVQESDTILTKHRVSAFYGTALDDLLKINNIKSLIIAGVATDLAVSSTVRDAHDRDYQVTILTDCCAAATQEDHDTSLLSLKKIAHVTTAQELFQ